MRRLFWVIAGALLGVTGYRRATQLARAVRTGGRRGGAPGGEHRPAWLRGQRRDAGWPRRVALFARDVRDGMQLYLDRHPLPAGPTLEGQRTRARRSRQAAGGNPGCGCPGVDHANDGRW
jgi:hypothetical protein